VVLRSIPRAARLRTLTKLVIERMEVERGGHWRYVEHGPEGVHGFEGATAR
jgi:hypothetical protein